MLMIKGMALKGVFFDFDGTLANSIDVMSKAYEMFLFEHSLQPSQSEFKKLNGPPLRVVVNQLKNKYKLPHKTEFLLNQYNEIIDKLYVDVSLNHGAYELIESAIENSCLLAIVTSNSKQRVNNWLSKLNLISKFNFVISGEDVALGKPHPEPYLLALQLAKVSHNQVVAVEDSLQGANSAIKANIKTYLLSNEISKGRYIEESFYSINSLLMLNGILFNKY
jgi:HAD superfamily hydrolase (TIGR01509 family)